MALQRAKLADIQQLPSTAAAVYTNPAQTKSFIRGFILFNSGTVAETIKIYNVPDNTGSTGTAAAANQFFEVSLAAKATLLLELPYVITLSDTGDAIFASSTSAATTTIQVLGDKE